MRSTLSTAAVLTAVFGMLVVSGGCDSSAGTAVAITGGAAAATVLGSQAVTGSMITVTVDSFDDTGLSGFDLPARTERCALTPRKIQDLHEKLKPFINQLRQGQESVNRTRNRIEKLPNVDKAMALLETDLTINSRPTEGVLNAWDAFDSQMTAAKSDGRICERELPILAGKLRDLRAETDRLAAMKTSNVFFAYLCDEVILNLRMDVDKLTKNGKKGSLLRVPSEFEQKVRTLGTGEGSAENVAGLRRLIEGVAGQIKKAEGETTYLDGALKAYGLTLGSSTQASTKADIGSMVDAMKESTAIAEDHVATGKEMRSIFNQITTSMSYGPIKDEAMQTLTTGGAIDAIMDPDNDGRWRKTFSKAESVGNTGNHNALIYFENMARPVLKSSIFDPTKFIVADGLLFRKAFFAASSIYGMPGGNPLGGDKGVVPSLHTMGAASQLADRKTKAAQDAIKNAVDETTTRQDGSKAKLDAFKAAREKCQDANASASKAEQAAEKAESAAKKATSQATTAAEAASKAAAAAAEAAAAAGVDPNALLSSAKTAVAQASTAVKQAGIAVGAADIAAESAGTTKVLDATKNAIAAAVKDAKDANDKAADPKQANAAAQQADGAAKKAAQAATEALAIANKAVEEAKKAVEKTKKVVAETKVNLEKQVKDRADYINDVHKAMLSAAAKLEGAGSGGN